MINILHPALFGLAAFLSAIATYRIFGKRFERAASRRASLPTALSGGPIVYLIRDGVLADSNFEGERFLQRFPLAPSGISRLRAALASQFDEVDALIRPGPGITDRHATSRDGNLLLVSEAVQNAVRIRIYPADAAQSGADDLYRRVASESELETLRESTEHSPFLVWREAPDGTPVWVNRAYADSVSATFGRERLLSWPLPRLFPDLRRGPARRLSLAKADGTTLDWFDCHATQIGSDTLFTAFNASATVQAETQLKDFMQTLTKTFAQLDIGLAIFDKSRRLVLFNPALTDLTNLPVDFLTARPSLVALLDKLRERRMLPEPRDYKSWRQSIAELEAAAADGTYSETWLLPGNRTFRVTGRPHPDGAIAFLIQDISAEVSLTRRFRAEIETGQTVLDNMEQAVAVFSASGAMILSNRAYRRLFSVDPEARLAPTSVTEATRLWHEFCAPTPVWGDVRDFAADNVERVEWSAGVTLRDGRAMSCRFIPLADDGIQAVFDVAGAIPLQAEDDALMEVV